MAKNSVVTSVVLPIDMREEIERLAKEDDRSFSYMARSLMEIGLIYLKKKKEQRKSNEVLNGK